MCIRDRLTTAEDKNYETQVEIRTGNGNVAGLILYYLSLIHISTLVISYIGYKNQEMKVIPGKSLNIMLQEETETLEEVVVVGYGVQKKSDVTGSVTSVGKRCV